MVSSVRVWPFVASTQYTRLTSWGVLFGQTNLDDPEDLGVLLDPILTFSDHTSTIVMARGVISFIKRWPEELNDPYTTKPLFISLVRPVLEYESRVWSPQCVVHSNRLKRSKKTSYCMPLRRLIWDAILMLPPYSLVLTSRLILINLPSLANRTVFIYKLFCDEVYCPDGIFV